MTKEEFQEWKSDSRTQEIFNVIERQCFDIAKKLSRTAGLDPITDRYEAGVIRGMERILEVDYEDELSD